jgi:hypothetical protein
MGDRRAPERGVRCLDSLVVEEVREAGGKGGYVGRDGRLPEEETSRFGPSASPEA